MSILVRLLPSLFALHPLPVLAEAEGNILYLNNCARQEYPDLRPGQSIRKLIPPLIEEQAPPFVAAVDFCARRVNLSVTMVENIRIFTIQPLSSTEEAARRLLNSAGGSMRTSMAGLQVSFEFVRQALEAYGDEKALKYSAMATHNYYQTLHVINNLYDLLSVTPSESSCFDLVQRVRELMESADALLRGRNLSFTLECEEKEILFYGSSSELDRILLNLLSNSLKAMPSGGQIRIRIRQQYGTAVITLSDTGCGIPPEVMSSVFQQYLVPQRRNASPGLGLGTVQHLVEKSGGTIILESMPDKGTTVTVSLPIRSHGMTLHSPRIPYQAPLSMAPLLTGLCDVLDYTYYMPKYMD